MDPDVTLKNLRDVTARLQRQVDLGEEPDAVTVDSAIELFKALDEWVSRGGFLPRAWQHSAPLRNGDVAGQAK